MRFRRFLVLYARVTYSSNNWRVTFMSSKAVHYSAGVVLGGISVFVGKESFEFWQLGLIAFGCVWGASAPDWMEISGWTFWGKRISLIPHRTVTHWLLGWLLATAWALWSALNDGSLEWCMALGFCLSATIHVLMDAPSPMGVPIVNPFRRPRASKRRC